MVKWVGGGSYKRTMQLILNSSMAKEVFVDEKYTGCVYSVSNHAHCNPYIENQSKGLHHHAKTGHVNFFLSDFVNASYDILKFLARLGPTGTYSTWPSN